MSKWIPTYWGRHRTLTNQPEYCLKQLWMRAGCQSSLEYHVRKRETYIVEEGELAVGTRHGRGENGSIRLTAGDTWHIAPGTMHMRIAVTDVLITEVSTHDDPADVFIVEDGRSYKHPYTE
jgi:mannose-6-phosphate isomerase-like protein (cupin superfamily)